ncbi:MAG: WXG100 family type VII secretion target [Desulfosalsimonadaceae bacterium]|nr:WXG100 family type VII secretion target [Desulfosalsimonadaceae bacterium]
MNLSVQLNYDELRIIAKRCKSNGEDIVTLLSKTRQKVHDLETEWIGEGAEKFFDEMETVLLPALHRTAQALFFSEEVLVKIVRVINEADKETASFFKHDLFEFEGHDFGNFSGIGENFSEGQAIPGNIGVETEAQTILGQNGGSSGLGKTGLEQTEAGPESDGQQEGASSSATQSSGGGTSRSNSGGTSSSGGTGDLNNMGSGVGAQTSSGTSGSTGGASSIGSQGQNDHIYEGSSFTETSGGEINNAGIAAKSAGQTSAGGEGAAAGAAVIGSASVGAAAKAVRGRKK